MQPAARILWVDDQPENNRLERRAFEELGTNVYVMQSYSQIVNKSLTVNQLPALGHVLSLPEGWRYREETPRHSIHLITTGIAYVVNDNPADSDDGMNQPGIELGGVPTGCVRRAFTVSVHVGGDTATTLVSVRPAERQAHHQQRHGLLPMSLDARVCH